MRYNNNIKPKTKEEKFEDMLQKFLKDSKKKGYEISDEHTKSGRKKAKVESSKRRKINQNKGKNQNGN